MFPGLGTSEVIVVCSFLDFFVCFVSCSFG